MSYRVFSILLLVISTGVALDSTNSDGSFLALGGLLGIPALLIAGFIAFLRLLEDRNARLITWRKAFARLGLLIAATVAIHWGIWWWLNPPTIEYRFSYGASGSYHIVKFWHLENGRKVEGPWISGWPMRVSFPDLNGDGFPDIRADGDYCGIAECIYLPRNDGKCFWHVVRKGRFQVSYPPEGEIGL